jgi:hypothetical protein
MNNYTLKILESRFDRTGQVKSDFFKKDAGCDYVEKRISLKFCTVKEGSIK